MIIMNPEKVHLLEDRQWHAVVPAGEVWTMKRTDYHPVFLLVGKTAVKSPFHGIKEFEETDCLNVEFHRYKDSWNVDGFNKTFEGEVVADINRIPVTVWLTELGFGVKAIDRPDNAQFEDVQLKLFSY